MARKGQSRVLTSAIPDSVICKNYVINCIIYGLEALVHKLDRFPFLRSLKSRKRVNIELWYHTLVGMRQRAYRNKHLRNKIKKRLINVQSVLALK
jgi:hypothetical protein